jgi:hypothetical protein
MRMRKLQPLLCSVVLLTFSVSTNAQTWLTNGLVAFYPFNGNANDESGFGNNGIVNGASLSPDRFGVSNRAYIFDGTNNFIELPDNAAFSSPDYTVSVWFNAAQFPMVLTHNDNEAAMLISRGRSNFELSLGAPPFVASGFRFLPRLLNAGTGQQWDARSAGYQIKRWQHVVGTYEQSGNIARLFLNGQELALTHTTGPDSANDSLPARLGNRYDGTVPFNGGLDDVRIYNRALSSNEIADLFILESPPVLRVKKAVYLESPNLKTGTNYQLQLSGDLTAWTNYGSPFTATNANWRTTNYWDVDNWAELFFRLVVP